MNDDRELTMEPGYAATQVLGLIRENARHLKEAQKYTEVLDFLQNHFLIAIEPKIQKWLRAEIFPDLFTTLEVQWIENSNRPLFKSKGEFQGTMSGLNIIWKGQIVIEVPDPLPVVYEATFKLVRSKSSDH